MWVVNSAVQSTLSHFLCRSLSPLWCPPFCPFHEAFLLKWPAISERHPHMPQTHTRHTKCGCVHVLIWVCLCVCHGCRVCDATTGKKGTRKRRSLEEVQHNSTRCYSKCQVMCFSCLPDGTDCPKPALPPPSLCVWVCVCVFVMLVSRWKFQATTWQYCISNCVCTVCLCVCVLNVCTLYIHTWTTALKQDISNKSPANKVLLYLSGMKSTADRNGCWCNIF